MGDQNLCKKESYHNPPFPLQGSEWNCLLISYLQFLSPVAELSFLFEMETQIKGTCTMRHLCTYCVWDLRSWSQRELFILAWHDPQKMTAEGLTVCRWSSSGREQSWMKDNMNERPLMLLITKKIHLCTMLLPQGWKPVLR